MATVQFQGQSLARHPDRCVAAVKRKPDLLPSSRLLAQELAHLGQKLLGIMLVVFGSALVLTLWLMPVGLPLALLGVALTAAPTNP